MRKAPWCVVMTYIDDRDNMYSNLLSNHGDLWNNLLSNHGNLLKSEALRKGSIVDLDASFFATWQFLYRSSHVSTGLMD